MIVLKYPVLDNKVSSWEEKLLELAVAHRLEEKKGLSVPVLEYGSRQYEGTRAIDAFFPAFVKELEEWRDDSCGG